MIAKSVSTTLLAVLSVALAATGAYAASPYIINCANAKHGDFYTTTLTNASVASIGKGRTILVITHPLAAG